MELLTSRTTKLRLIYDAYHALGGFDTGHYLDQFYREQDSPYDDRRASSVYDNHLNPACARYAGYLAKTPPEFIADNPLLEAVFSNFDQKGSNIVTWMLESAQEFKPYGLGLAVVSMPKGERPANLSAQIEQGFLPYVSRLIPHEVTSYEISRAGKIEKLEIARQEFVNGKVTSVTRYWDAEQWWMKHGTTVLDQGEVVGGLCPIIPFCETEFPMLGEFSQIADLSKKIYNVESSGDNILNNQAFSILCYPVPIDMAGQLNDQKITGSVGTKNMLKFFGPTAPLFVSPDTGPSDSINTRIDRIVQRIREITYQALDPSQVETGIAKERRFQDLNSSLAKYAGRMESFSKQVIEVMCAMLGIPEDQAHSSWPRDFDITDAQQEFDILDRMQENNFPPEAIALQKEQIIKVLYPNLSDESETEIYGKIREDVQEDVG